MFPVMFFVTKSRREPAKDFILSLNKDDRKVVGEDLKTIQYGFPIGMPVCRPLGGGLYEVRSTLPSKREARLIFFQDEEKLVIVSGFIKKTQKTPAGELEKANYRKTEYERNKIKH